MTLVDDRAASAACRLARRFLVVITADGAHIPAIDGHERVALGYAELLLIEQLARYGIEPLDERVASVTVRTGCPPEHLHGLYQQLEARQLIAAGEVVSGDARTPVDKVPAPPDAPQLDPGDALVATTPLVFGVEAGGFVHFDHDGHIALRAEAVHLALLRCFLRPCPVAEALVAHAAEAGDNAVPDAHVALVLQGFLGAGLLSRFDPSSPAGVRGDQLHQTMVQAVRRFVEANERRVRQCEAQPATGTPTDRPRVVAVPPDVGFPPLALGMLLAHALAYEGGRLQRGFDLTPDWHLSRQRQASFAERPGIFLFSNYTWSHPQNLERSATIKRINPWNVTIHGGPDTPKYERDAEAYFRANPHIDIAVRGEGEVTTAELLAALAGAVGDGAPDLSALQDVPGLTFRNGDELIRTPDRDRIVDIDALPSPYLTGLFDTYAEAGAATAIIETNRGCPYSCSFCDWGSATLSRIRKFSLERVFAELEWCARHEIDHIFLADANFGIIERDVEIAEKVAELRSTYGYPRMFTTNYAKNTVKHLRKIVEAMADAGVITEGLLSLQSMDADTLKTINRSNIKVDKYDELAREFRRARLPLLVDLMVGLPGQTAASFRNDLQECIDREVTAKIFPTEVLVNSPMNDPAYRDQHQIGIAPGGAGWYNSTRLQDGDTGRRLVVSTATFTRQDYEEMLDLRLFFLLCENFGVLRQVSRWVRQEHRLPEVVLYDGLRREVRANADRWPVIALTLQVVPDLMVPPLSWRLFIDEIRRYLLEKLHVADPALDTVLAVQHALLPARDRRFPLTLDLEHDFTQWHRAMLEAKDAGHRRDWASLVPHLRDLPPARFTVDDKTGVCALGIGSRLDENHYGDWELTSPVARTVSAWHRARNQPAG